MPFRRQSLRPIKTDKHELVWSNLVQNASAVQEVTLVTGVSSADKNTSTECEVGSHVKSMYFEFHFSADTVVNPKVIHWNIVLLRTGETAQNPNSYYGAGRSHIIKRGMEMLPQDQSTVYKRQFVVRIPKGQQRIRDNTDFRFRYICSSAEAINTCGIVIYKEFY